MSSYNRMRASSSVHQTPLTSSKYLPSSLKTSKTLGSSSNMNNNEVADLPIEGAQRLSEALSSSFSIVCGPEDINKPTPGFVQLVMSAFVADMMGIDATHVIRARDALLPSMVYKEIYTDALQFAMFFRHCRKFCDVAGIHDLKQSDLIRPEGQRFRQILSYCVNLGSFSDQRRAFVDELWAECDAERVKVERKQVGLERLTRELQEEQAKREAEEPLAADLRARNKELEAVLYGLRQTQVKLKEETDDLDRERNELRARLAALIERETEATKENIDISSRIVQSPARIKTSIASMARQQAELKQTHQSLARRAREFESRLGVMKDLEVDLRGLIDLAKNVDGDKAKVAELRNEITRVENELAGEIVRLNSTISRIEQLQRQIMNSRDRLERQQRMADDARNRKKDEMEKLRVVHATKLKERGHQQREVEAMQMEKRAMEEEIEAFREQSDAQVNKVVEEYFELRDQMDEYMRAVNSKLGLDLDRVLASKT